MLSVEDIWSAIDQGYEEIAQLQYDLAVIQKISGDPDIYDKEQMRALELSMYIDGLKILDYGIDIDRNSAVDAMVYNIRKLTKDLRRWD